MYILHTVGMYVRSRNEDVGESYRGLSGRKHCEGE